MGLHLRFFCVSLGYIFLLLLVTLLYDRCAVRQNSYNLQLPRLNLAFLKLNVTEGLSPNSLPISENNTWTAGFPQISFNSTPRNKSIENLCPLIPPNLVGFLPVKRYVPSMDKMHYDFPDVNYGGRYRPKHCTARHRVAIIVPYRDREDHLQVFIYHMHRFLSNQQIDYGIFIIEQGDDAPFNRAKLLNVGFVESLKLYDYECFIFHDVDLLPVDDRNLYTCPQQPRHMCVTIDRHTGVYYPMIFGGVSALSKEHMLRANGFSNSYWGWGAEDDDMSYRLQNLSLKIRRRSPDIASYVSLAHRKTTRSNSKNLNLLATWNDRRKSDGLTSLAYRVLDKAFNRLYTWIKVDLRTDQLEQRRITLPYRHSLTYTSNSETRRQKA